MAPGGAYFFLANGASLPSAAGTAATLGGFFGAFGFLISRLLRFCPLAMTRPFSPPA
jgi:hypothetical protein